MKVKQKSWAYFFVGTKLRLGLFVSLQSFSYIFAYFFAYPINIAGLIFFSFILPLFYLFVLRWFLEEVDDYETFNRVISKVQLPFVLSEFQSFITPKIKIFSVVHLIATIVFTFIFLFVVG